MKLPKEIIGKNRIRDFYICNLYIKGHTAEEITEIIQNKCITPVKLNRCYKIISANSVYINKYIGWSKSKRIHLLQKWVKKNDSSKKDPADLIEQIRREIEGEKPLIEQHTHITYVRENAKSNDSIQTSRLPV